MLEKINIVLLRVCKIIKTIIKKNFKIDLIDQLSKINDNQFFLKKI